MPNIHTFKITPVDTWFFRDGRPMEIKQGVHTIIESSFPPSSQTVVGAMRAALSRANGWNGKGNWSEGIRDVLGTYEDLGTLTFTGPHIICDETVYYPMPLNVLGTDLPDGTWCPRTILKPGTPVKCDLGDAVRLPQAVKSEPGLKNGFGHYVTQQGLKTVLQEAIPAMGDIIGRDALFAQEKRIGLARDAQTRSAIQGALYNTVHTRLKENVSICVGVDGLPKTWNLPSGLLQIGGEARMAELQIMSNTDQTLFAGEKTGAQCSLILLTPVDFGDWQPLPGTRIPGAEGLALESCCIERPYRIGGWCSVRRMPLPRRPLYPAGSVLYCTVQDDGKTTGETISIGKRTEYGFGLAAIGSWTD